MLVLVVLAALRGRRGLQSAMSPTEHCAVGCWETENDEAAASPNDLFRRTLVSMTVSIVSQ